MLLRERSMAHCFALDAGPCKDANGGNKGINNDVHRLEPMQGKEPAHFLAHFLRHSSSTSGDQGEVLVRKLACGGPVIPLFS